MKLNDMQTSTPWTLASEVVWVRTHRVTAWVWTATGFLGFALVLAGLPFWVALVLLLVSVFFPIVYSFWLYKQLQSEGKT